MDTNFRLNRHHNFHARPQRAAPTGYPEAGHRFPPFARLAPSVRLDPAAAPEAAGDTGQRLVGIREDLANAVAWGTVTPEQAADFYARMAARIAGQT